MKKQLLTLLVGIVVGGGVFGAGQAIAAPAKPKPSAYCKVADIGKKVWYTTPSGSSRYQLKCTKKTTQAWKRAS